MTWADILSALIWTCVLGLAVGNYATSFIYRLPKTESPFTKHPYCGGCGTMLQSKDLFPAVSWLLLRGKCRYCAMEIPAVYFWTEIFCAAIFMLAVLSLGFSEAYILVVAAGTCMVTLWGLELRTGKLFFNVLTIIAALGFTYRTLHDGTIYSALYGMIWGGGLPLIAWRLKLDKENINGEKQRLTFPPGLSLGATAGIWVAPFGLLLFVPLWIGLTLLYKLGSKYFESWPSVLRTAPYGLALVLLMIYPQWIEEMRKWLLALIN